MHTCPFCDQKNIEDRVITKNEFAVAFPSIKPIGVAHLLIIPKRHAEVFDDLSQEEQQAVFNLATQLRKALKKTFNVNGFNCAWNEGETSGQSVPHFHFHLIPRAEDDTSMYGYEPREFLYRRPLSNNTPEQELAEIAELIKSNL